MKRLFAILVSAFAACAHADATNDTVYAALVEKYGGESGMERWTCAETANVVAEYAANPEANPALSPDLDALKRGVLRSALGIVKRSLREHGRTFVVGPDGSNPVQEVLDALSAALNAPKMAGLGAWVAEWCPPGHEWREPSWMSETDVAAFTNALYYGERDFGRLEQTRLCAVLGVEAYNAFVIRYNGDEPEPVEEPEAPEAPEAPEEPEEPEEPEPVEAPEAQEEPEPVEETETAGTEGSAALPTAAQSLDTEGAVDNEEN